MQWPPSDPKLAREASILLEDLEFTSRASGTSSRCAMNLSNLLGRLLSIALQVVPQNLFEFLVDVNKFIDILPSSSTAGQLLEKIFRGSPEVVHPTMHIIELLHWTARWYTLGSPAITLDSNLATSLIATETADEFISTIEPPWVCFIVRLPRDLVEMAQLKFTHLIVNRYFRFNDLSWWPTGVPERWLEDPNRTVELLHRKFGYVWCIGGATEDAVPLWRSESLRVLLGKDRPEFLFDDAPDTSETPEDRVVQALARLVVGICHLAENPKALRPKSTKKQQHRWRFSKLPLTTEYVLAPDVPVKFDCTEAVGAFLRGERKGPPRFQWIVRGHWRNQVHGPGRTGRKRIWIQPYWKGPEDARRLFREYRFEGKKEGE